MADNRDETNAENNANDWPDRDPSYWLSASFFMGCILLVFVLFSALFVAGGTDFPTGAKERAEILWPIGATLIAITTFLTVIWRGTITYQQTCEQKRQNDANDDAAYSNLLVEGAKLLGEANENNKIAGIAILEKVLQDPQKDRLQFQAMNILASYFRDNHIPLDPSSYNSLSYLREVLNSAAASGRRSSVSPTFVFNENPAFKRDNLQWPPVSGFNILSYNGGWFGNWLKFKNDKLFSENEDQFEIISKSNVIFFEYVKFENCTIPKKNNFIFKSCIFESCTFLGITDNYFIDVQSISGCCFSNTKIFLESSYAKHTLDNLSSRPEAWRGNWFKKGREPKISVGPPLDWGDYFEER